jgi:esterase/lipase superfamily enzyme
VLVAPDIDTQVFREEIAPKLAAAGGGVTLYAYSDLALQIAQTVRSGRRRGGDLRDGAFVWEGIDTIDATGTDFSVLGQSKFLTEDMFYLINHRQRAHQRFLNRVPVGTLNLWKIRR